MEAKILNAGLGIHLHKVCVSLMYKLMHIEWATLVRRFGLNNLFKVTDISGRAGKGSEECIFKGKKQLRYKTTSVLKCIISCEFYNYNNEFLSCSSSKFRSGTQDMKCCSCTGSTPWCTQISTFCDCVQDLILVLLQTIYSGLVTCTSITYWFIHLGKSKRVLYFVNYCASSTLYKSRLPSLHKKYSKDKK